MSKESKSPSLNMHLLGGSIVGLVAGIILIRGIESSLGTGFHLYHYAEALIGIVPGLVLGGLTFLVHTFIKRSSVDN